jgi:hypothetical protein
MESFLKDRKEVRAHKGARETTLGGKTAFKQGF